MGLETGDFISDLVITNPVTATDPVTEGSNHLQLIKKVLKGSFGEMAGLWQLPTNDLYITQRNFAGDGFINMIKVNASDEVQLSGPVRTLGDIFVTGNISVGSDPSTAGGLRMRNNNALSYRNAANDDNITCITY